MKSTVKNNKVTNERLQKEIELLIGELSDYLSVLYAHTKHGVIGYLKGIFGKVRISDADRKMANQETGRICKHIQEAIRTSKDKEENGE